MGKISDALEKHGAEREQNRVEIKSDSAITPKASPQPKRTSKRSSKGAVKSYAVKSDLSGYEDILTRLHTQHPGESIKTIMFTGATHGGGATTTAVNFAKTLVRDHQVKVLLIDANMRTPNLRELFDIKTDEGLTDIVLDNNAKPYKVINLDPSYLFVLATGGNYVGPVGLFESERFDAFLENVREEFDYVILDSAPLPSFAEARVLCEKVDGVVLVVESGKLRRHVALRAKKELEDAGAQILGVVLNKRKYHIPEWLYKRL
jgi:capsular exopolysaccharide synthesis family protein